MDRMSLGAGGGGACPGFPWVSGAPQRHETPSQRVRLEGGSGGRRPWRGSHTVGSGVLEEDPPWGERFGGGQCPRIVEAMGVGV